MRKLLLGVAALVVVGALAWGLWPATNWPSAFCTPIHRIVGSDVDAILRYGDITHDDNTTKSASLRDALLGDVILAEHHAPTHVLHRELMRYSDALVKTPTVLTTMDALSTFDGKARTQLRACGITPIGR